MSVLTRVLKGAERRSAPQLAYPGSASYSSFPFYPRLNTTGQNVTVENAMELVPVYGAVSMLAGAIGSLPLKVYRDAEPRTEAKTSRQWRLLHDQPNDEMAADEFWEIIAASLLLWGNAFVFKQRNGSGQVEALWPIRPSRVQVGRESIDGQTVRFFRLDNNKTGYETDILQIRGLGTDGLVGLSPIQQARQQLAVDQAHQEFQGTFLKNGMFPSVVFTHPNTLSKEAKERLQDDIKDRSSWLEAGFVPVLEEGSDLKNLTMPLADAQFVEQAGMADHRVAQLFGLVPPHQWGVAGQGGKGSMTYQNSEFGGLEFVKWSVRRWLVRIEKSVARDPGIFPPPGPVLFPEFVVDALLRSDTLSRYQAYQIAIDSGFMTAGQVQALENIEPDDSVLEGEVMPTELTPPVTPPALPPAQPDQAPARSIRDAGEAVPGASLAILDDLRTIFRPEIRVELPQPAPVYVNTPRQLPPDVLSTVNVDMQPVADALDRLTEAVGSKELAVTVEPAVVTVNQAPQPVQLQLELPAEPAEPDRTVRFERDAQGRIKSATVTDA